MELNIFYAKVLKCEVDIEEGIEIQIGDKKIEAFTIDDQFNLEIGSLYKVKLIPDIFDEIDIKASNNQSKEILQVQNSFAYILKGLYYADEQIIDVGFKIDLSENELHDYGYLDGKYIQVYISRFNLKILSKVK